MLKLETLESRDCPTSVSLTADGVLSVKLTGTLATNAVSFDAATTQITATINGRSQSFDAAAVKFIDVQGSLLAPNVVQNNTSVNFNFRGGLLSDTVFGGTGTNVIDPGLGDDVVYALLGVNTILTRGEGRDKVFTNYGATVSADAKDTVVRFFAPGRTPGVPFIGVQDGVLYITPSNNGSTVTIDPIRNGSVQVTYDLGDGKGLLVRSFAGVNAIAYFGGSGTDRYVNNTGITEAAYGSAGNDVLVGGFGYSLLKGSGGDDVLVGRGRRNDISGNAGNDVIVIQSDSPWGSFLNPNIIRAGAEDVVVGAGWFAVRLAS